MCAGIAQETDYESRVNKIRSAFFVPGLRTYLSEFPQRLEGPTKTSARNEHLNEYGKSDPKICLL